MQASITGYRPTGPVSLRQHLVLGVAIPAESHIGVARVAVRLKVSSIQRVRELVVERMRGSVHVIPFMTILTVARLMTGLALHAAERLMRIEASDDSMCVEEITGMGLRKQHGVGQMAARALLGHRL